MGNDREIGELKAYARDLMVAGFHLLRSQEALPRPKVRYLEMGRHYSGLDLMNLPEFTALAEAVASVPRISNIHRRGAHRIGDFFRPYLETLFERVLNDTRDDDVDEASFEKWFSRFESELLSPAATFVDIWGLQGLEMEVRDIRIDDNAGIHRFAPRELDALLEANVGMEDWAWDKQLYWDGLCALILTQRVNKANLIDLSDGTFYAIDKLHLILTSIRLHKEGNAWPAKWIRFHRSDFPLTRPMVIQTEHMRSRPGSPYKLVETDAQSIRQLAEDVHWLRKVAPEDDASVRKLRLALSFFESSYAMKIGIESLVDLCIALEALFLQERQELSYRLAHRVAALLGTNDKNSQELFKRIRALYDLRSAYVHGDPLSAEKESRLLARIADAGPNAVRRWVMPILAIQDCVRQSLELLIRMRRKNALNLNSSFYQKIDQFVLDKKARLKFQRSVGLVPT